MKFLTRDFLNYIHPNNIEFTKINGSLCLFIINYLKMKKYLTQHAPEYIDHCMYLAILGFSGYIYT